MKRILIIGAGQIGSRHLQALKKVRYPLEITVYDPSLSSLIHAQKRFDSVVGNSYKKSVYYTTDFFSIEKSQIDIAIIATSSIVRKSMTEMLLRSCKVRFLILEKLLFHKKRDFYAMQKIIKKTKTKAYVNCSMRMVPHYEILRNKIKDKKIFYHVSGRAFGLITNVIHYIDHLAYLCGSQKYSMDTTRLEKKPYQSKRKGFLEYDGTLMVKFNNGSLGIFTSYTGGSAPIAIQISNNNIRASIVEAQETMFISEEKNSWKWKKIHVPFPYQSVLTQSLVEDILNNGKCGLASFQESAKIHLIYLESLKKHLNKNSRKKYSYYPFT